MTLRFGRVIFRGVRILSSILATMVLAAVVVADDSYPAPSNVRDSEYPRLGKDGRVTFRLHATNAAMVKVEGGAGLLPHPLPMKRGTNGVWSITTDPAVPGFHYYWFDVDGLRINDPGSFSYFGYGRECSGIEIPEAGVDFYDAKTNLTHGEVRSSSYFSKITGKWRHVNVYTPPDYDRDAATRFPVLYLLHGAGENERGWIQQGQAQNILDNLIGSGAAKPMILVVDSGYASFATNANSGSNAPENVTAAFEAVMLKELIPFVDARYRTASDREHRAMAGLSMGSAQTLIVTTRHLDQFAWIGAMSSAPRQSFEVATAYGGGFRDAERFKSQVKLLWFGAGTAEEKFHKTARETHEALERAGIPSVFYSSPGTDHEWQTWRRSLYDFVPRLFR